MLNFIHLNKFKFPSHPWAVTTVSPVNTANTALWAEPVVEQREFAVSCTPGSGDFTKTNEKSNYQTCLRDFRCEHNSDVCNHKF